MATVFKQSVTVWISEDWVKAMFQKYIVLVKPMIAFVPPGPDVNMTNPMKYKLTLEAIK